MSEYDDSIELDQLLRSYERSKRQGKPCYFDSDDYVDIVEYYMRNEQFQEALDAVEEGLSLHHRDSDLRSLKANVLICLQRYDEAEKLVEAIDPSDDPDVYYFRGQLACAYGHPLDERTQWFRTWMETEREECRQMSDDEEAHTRMREAYMHVIMSIVDISAEDNLDDIIIPWVDEYIEQCTPLVGDDIDLDIARACHEVELIDKEIELYNLMLDINPYLPQGYTYLASLQSSMDYNEDAIESAEFALAIDADDTQALLVKALSNYQLTNFAQAAIDFRKFIDTTGDGVYYAMLASCLMRTGQKNDAYCNLGFAQDYVTHHISDGKIKAGARSYIAEIYLMGGFYDEALKMINLALRNNKHVPEFLMQKGIILLSQKKTVRAMHAFFEAVNAADRKFPFLTLAGGELMAKGYTEVAMMLLTTALRFDDDPDFPKIYIYMAQGHYLMRHTDMFLKYLKKACQYTPELVRTCWSDELIGIAPDHYYQTLHDLLLGRMGDDSKSRLDRINDTDMLFDSEEPLLPF